ILLDAADAVLSSFGPGLATRTKRDLEKVGIEVRLNTMVVDVDASGLEVRSPDGSTERLEATTKVWGARVQANPLTKTLAEQSGAERAWSGRSKVTPDLRLPGHPHPYAVGDMVALHDVPGVAQGAIQKGGHAADQLLRRLRGEETGEPFV